MSSALLAFAIGSFVVYEFCWKTAEQSVIAQTTKVNKSDINEKPRTSIQEPSQIEELNDKAAFEVLQPTIKKWLRGEKIKNELTHVSDESIKKISGKSKAELSEDETKWFDAFRFEPTLIDVDSDGKNELAIRNNCAMVGNCQFWLFKKKGNDYQLILKTLEGAVQTFKLKSSKTKGYFDIETKNHGDAWSGGIEIYKFDGEKYKVAECFDYNYSYLKNGKLYELKNPKITITSCSED